jgi:hypothetical protein
MYVRLRFSLSPSRTSLFYRSLEHTRNFLRAAAADDHEHKRKVFEHVIPDPSKAVHANLSKYRHGRRFVRATWTRDE